MRIMFIDGSDPMTYDHAFALSKLLINDGVTVVLASDKEPSYTKKNFEVINLRDVPQNFSMDHFQRKYNFSIYKSLVPERAFFDYCTFNNCQKYSSLSEDEIEDEVLPYVNAFDYIIKNKVDIIFESLADTFKTNLAGRIASFYKKKIYLSYLYYWWKDGCFFLDRLDQTSSKVDARYMELISEPELLKIDALNDFYSAKQVGFIRSDNRVFPLFRRLSQFRNRRKSYNPLSLKNWVCRRFHMYVAPKLVCLFVKRYNEELGEEKFLIYPLHVTPEAVLIGASPEIADQFSLIKNISMNLPFGVKLYVKEHPDQRVGIGLDYGFYRRITTLPNVRVIQSKANLSKLLESRNCLGVTVIAGTTGLEAAMKRKAVFVFGTSIYSIADCFIKPKNWEDFFCSVKSVMEGSFVFNETALYAILQTLDDCVVRADVDYGACRTSWEMGVASQKIVRNFLLDLNGQKDDHNLPFELSK